MKKTLVALAALAATSAFAQSSVTISGNIDLGYASTKQVGLTGTVGTTAPTAPDVTKESTGVIGKANSWTSNAIKLTVAEDIGNGLKAGYVGEMNVGTWGTGVDAADQLLGTARQAFGTISGGFGEVRLGYQYTLDDQVQGGVGRATPTGNVGGRVQNFGNIGFAVKPGAAAPGAGTVAQEYRDVITAGHITRANGFEYSSPVFSGFQAKAQFATQGADTSSTAQVGKDGKATGKNTGYAGFYSNGPLNVALSQTQIISDAASYGDATKGQKVDQKLTDLAANYDLGAAKLFLNNFQRTADVTQGSTYASGGGSATATTYGYFGQAGGQIKRSGTDLGVSVPFGAVTVFGSTGKGKYQVTQASGVDALAYNVKGTLVGVTYDFSKRTSVNAYFTETKLEASDASLKNTILGAGLRHQF